MDLRAHLAAVLRSKWAIPLSIALITFIAFSPALRNGFVEWDDDVNLLSNPHYRGLGWPQLRWMFTTTLMGHYIPLTWMTFGLDYLLWGMNPLGYHLTSLLLHATNASLFYLLALRLLRQALTGTGEPTLRLAAGTAALFFALHPLRVESVAWATERRDVLSGLFFLLTILLYLRASEAERGRRLLTGSVGCYALALASKSVVMTLPLVLILLDLYPLRRLGNWREWTTPAARRIWVEKVPYLLLATAGAGVALYAASSHLTPLERYPLPARLAMTLYSLWFYLWKTLLPLGLSPLYELPAQVSLLDPPFLLSAIAVGAITMTLLLMPRRWPAGLAVWAYYAITLAPLSGLVHAGHQITHDRYSYLSCLGWALLLGGGVCAVIRAHAAGTLGPSLARVAAGAIALWFISLAVLTSFQIKVWRDTETLWIHAIELDSRCSICHANVGAIFDDRGLPGAAFYHLQRAIALRPDRLRARMKLGIALLHAGQPAEAIPHFQYVLARYPAAADAQNHLGIALLRTGRPDEAIPHLQQVLARDPSDADAQNHLGIALTLKGEREAGIEHLRRAVELNPTHFEARMNLGMALAQLGDPAAAVEHFRRAIDLKPEAPVPRLWLERLNHGPASQLAPQLDR